MVPPVRDARQADGQGSGPRPPARWLPPSAPGAVRAAAHPPARDATAHPGFGPTTTAIWSNSKGAPELNLTWLTDLMLSGRHTAAAKRRTTRALAPGSWWGVSTAPAACIAPSCSQRRSRDGWELVAVRDRVFRTVRAGRDPQNLLEARVGYLEGSGRVVSPRAATSGAQTPETGRLDGHSHGRLRRGPALDRRLSAALGPSKRQRPIV